MKDLQNFEILQKPEGTRVRYRMRHKKHDGLHIEFDTGAVVKAADIPALIQGVMRAWSNKFTAMTRGRLTPSQKKFYDALVWFWKQEGRAPSYEEQAEMLGKKSRGTPYRYAQRLIVLGWLWKDEGGQIVPCDIALPEGME